MPYADVENGPSPRDIPWYAHFDTWDELYKAEYEDDPDAMESANMYRHEVFVDGGGPDEFRKTLVDMLADALTEYEAGAGVPFDVPDGDGFEHTWTKEDRDNQIWEAVMSLAYYDWIRAHSDMFDPALWEAEHTTPDQRAIKRIGQVRLEKYSDS